MYMFTSVLERIPKNRSELVNELDVPDEIVSSCEPTADAPGHGDVTDIDVDRSDSSDSSLSLSRAMTDSEIDYESYRRLKSRSFSDPWAQMKAALDAFPPGYIDSLKSYEMPSKCTEQSSEYIEQSRFERKEHMDQLRLKMQRFLDQECRVYEPNDPGYLILQRTIQELDLTESDSTGM